MTVFFRSKTSLDVLFSFEALIFSRCLKLKVFLEKLSIFLTSITNLEGLFKRKAFKDKTFLLVRIRRILSFDSYIFISNFFA